MVIVMSDIFRSLLKLSAVPARFGLVAADAAVTVGKSIVEPEQTQQNHFAPAARFTAAEINAAAQITSMTIGRDTTFLNLLELNFPEATIRAMAEAALIAARDVRLQATTGTGTQH
ncbi:hypothetical protein GGQ85_003856 [Nitrobacter vulgaris]|uniref:hypothetical protein n=1 Tax=Nitrobacter vulgaris TaxID=29421 RepID=UPI0028563E8F|nr:hypothetical protein [Nitrobacter vulgaris]MDR6306128.1 hypothetical protein [Nitrobacter vulgaris]